MVSRTATPNKKEQESSIKQCSEKIQENKNVLQKNQVIKDNGIGNFKTTNDQGIKNENASFEINQETEGEDDSIDSYY